MQKEYFKRKMQCKTFQRYWVYSRRQHGDICSIFGVKDGAENNWKFTFTGKKALKAAKLIRDSYPAFGTEKWDKIDEYERLTKKKSQEYKL